jgi:hypothetical protein
VVPPAPGGFPLGVATGRLGRSQAPQPLVDLGLVSAAGELAPLHLARAWSVPGDGPARGVVYGSEGDHPAIELVEVDTGRVVWRDVTICAAPIVGTTAEAIVCADASGTRAIGLDGKPRWATPSPFLAFTDARVVVSGPGASIILDAASGDELARVTLPPGVAVDAILASCGDAGRELFAVGEDGRLVRIGDALGEPAIRWAVPLGTIVALDACDTASVVVTETGPAGASLVAIARATGKITGRVDGVAGSWPARDGSDRLEIASSLGVARYPRDLAGDPEPARLPPLGELLASRGDRRLVRATPRTAALLDRDGVRAYVPLAAMGAVLGDSSLLATSWFGSAGETVHRLALPSRWKRTLRLPALRRGVAVDAELRDLPPVVELDVAGAVAQPDTDMHAVIAHAIDPRDGAAVYAIAIPERSGIAGGGDPDGDAGGAGGLPRGNAERSGIAGGGTPTACAPRWRAPISRRSAGAGSGATAAAPGRPSGSPWRATLWCAARGRASRSGRRCARPATTAWRAGTGAPATSTVSSPAATSSSSTTPTGSPCSMRAMAGCAATSRATTAARCGSRSSRSMTRRS